MTILAPLSSLTVVPPHADKQKAAQELEKALYTSFLKQMFPEESSYFGNSHTATLIRPLWIEAMAGAGGAGMLGLTPAILRQLNKGENHARHPDAPVL